MKINKGIIRGLIKDCLDLGLKREELVILITDVKTYKEFLRLIHVMPNEIICKFDDIIVYFSPFYSEDSPESKMNFQVVKNEGQSIKLPTTFRH